MEVATDAAEERYERELAEDTRRHQERERMPMQRLRRSTEDFNALHHLFTEHIW
jgi:hypothetical protein